MSDAWRRLLARLRGEDEPLGPKAERLAARHLKRHGMRIVTRNWSTKLGELDLVAVEGDELVFVEVKSKRDDEYGRPAEQVNFGKRRRIERLAMAFCGKKKLDPPVMRFDVVEVIWSDPPRIEWIRGAWLAGE
ncbi:MAG: YraN family protein [Candidatus Lernaella stagnicola]|nr:YraN family protein [Candidatus Lernaella stagnicola]